MSFFLLTLRSLPLVLVVEPKNGSVTKVALFKTKSIIFADNINKENITLILNYFNS